MTSEQRTGKVAEAIKMIKVRSREVENRVRFKPYKHSLSRIVRRLMPYFIEEASIKTGVSESTIRMVRGRTTTHGYEQ